MNALYVVLFEKAQDAYIAWRDIVDQLDETAPDDVVDLATNAKTASWLALDVIRAEAGR